MKEAQDHQHGRAGLDSVDEIAADWVARIHSGFTPAEDAELKSWLATDPAHQAAFDAAEDTWTLLEKPRLAGRSAEAMEAIAHEGRGVGASSRKKIIAVSLVCLTAAAAFAVIFLSTRLSPITPNRVSLSPERQTLPDGSVVQLNSGAEIAVQFTDAQRGVRLLRGEAHFAVTKNLSRPFLVMAEGIRVRAVGTAFDVRLGSDSVDVLVTEGKVRVDAPTLTATAQSFQASASARSLAPSEASTYVSAGERTVVPFQTKVSPVVVAVTPAEIDHALAWRSLRVEFRRTALSSALDIFNHHNQVQLSLGDPALADLQIGGVFWADDPDGFVRLLESSAGIKADRQPDGRIILRRQ